MKKLLLGLLFAASQVHATPNITLATGTLTDGQAVTFLGDSFLAVSTATYVWETAESGSLQSSWSYTGNVSVNSDNNRHVRSTKNGKLNFVSGVNDGFFRGGVNSAKWFVQYWSKLGSDWDWGTTTFTGTPANRFLSNVKILRFWSTASIDENVYWQLPGDVAGASSYVADENVTGTNSYIGAVKKTSWNDNAWHLIQCEFQDSTQHVADGIIRIWFDGQAVLTKTNLMTRDTYSQNKRPYIVGFVNAWGPNTGESDDAPNSFYIDDVSIMNDWSRVELGDSVNYSSCTVREFQPVASWSPTSISVTLNQGSFANGTTTYAFITDTNGVRNGTGFTFVIGNSGSGGPGGGGTEPPASGNNNPSPANFLQINCNNATLQTIY